MKTPRKQPCRKNEYQKVSFDLKLSIIAEINNGQISANYASKKYGISRGTLAYWIKKLSNFESKSKAMSKNDELKKLIIEKLSVEYDINSVYNVLEGIKLDISEKIKIPQTTVNQSTNNYIKEPINPKQYSRDKTK